MKKYSRLIAMILTIAALFTVFCCEAFAKDHQTGAEKFEGVSREDKEAEEIEEIYEDIIKRAYEFDDRIVLPELEDMNKLDEIKIKYVQAKNGRVQKIYDEPKGEGYWGVGDSELVKVYAKWKGYYFVEVMLNKKESEGTFGWIPTTYVVNKWKAETSIERANNG